MEELLLDPATRGTAESVPVAVHCCAAKSGVSGSGTSCGSDVLAPDELTALPTTARRLAWSSSAILFVRRATTGDRCIAEDGRSMRGWNIEPVVEGELADPCTFHGVGMYESETSERGERGGDDP